MLLRDEGNAAHFLENISYYRLKGYWWDRPNDFTNLTFHSNTCFKDIIDRYNFDRHLRLILFDAIELLCYESPPWAILKPSGCEETRNLIYCFKN